MKPIWYLHEITLGCDPEFYFSKNNKIIGSEKVLSEEGISSGSGKIVTDGIQAEINPTYSVCRQSLASNIASCFRNLFNVIHSQNIDVNFSTFAKVEKEEFDSLSDKSKVFGCLPSENVHNKSKNKISVNPQIHRFRTAGGHIHLGHVSVNKTEKAMAIKEALKNIEVTIPVLDAVLGNTCVLIDKDPWNRVRRKIYGKAGEFRTTGYGLEYRTLSNFWLSSYAMMSFVTGMARFAVLIVANGYGKEILDNVDILDVATAINENDYELAFKNYEKLEGIMLELAGSERGNYIPFNASTVGGFRHFIESPLSYWFKEKTISHWMGYNSNYRGWEKFCENDIMKDKINSDKLEILNNPYISGTS